jgi:hypothetical protein
VIARVEIAGGKERGGRLGDDAPDDAAGAD